MQLHTAILYKHLAVWFCSHLPFVRVIICSICSNKANVKLNAYYYALDVSRFEVLTLIWLGRKRGMMQKGECGWRMSRG